MENWMLDRDIFVSKGYNFSVACIQFEAVGTIIHVSVSLFFVQENWNKREETREISFQLQKEELQHQSSSLM